MEIRKIEGVELNKALKLVWEVFLECEAFDYNRNGVEEFRKFIDNRQLFKIFETYGAYMKNELVGVISMQDEQHMCLFFVKREYQKMGVGTKLFEYVMKKSPHKEITVNLSLIHI